MLTNALQPITKRQFSSRRVYWLARFSLLLILALGFAGCQRRDEAIAGIEIPIPREMKKVPDKMFKPIPGFEDGQATFEGKVPTRDIFTFYQENMAARGWKPTTFMGGQKDQLAYSKDNRVCLVWYTPNDNGITSLTIMIGTLRPPA